MKFYSDFAAQRSRQITVDLFAVVFIAAWIWLGVTVYSLVVGLKGFGKDMQTAGAGFRSTMTDLGDTLGSTPIIGGGIRGPFDSASEAGATLEAAGASQQVAVQNLATGLGLAVAVLPVLAILVVWLLPRIRFARRASSTARLVSAGAGIDLLALRALSRQRLTTLAAVDADPMAAWRRGDESVIRSLASLELKSSGVRLT